MAEFFFNYGLFALKTLTLFGLTSGLVFAVGSFLGRSGGGAPEHFEVTRWNDRIERESEALGGALLDDETWHENQKEKLAQKKLDRKALKKSKKLAKKSGQPVILPPAIAEGRKRLYVLDFDGDLQASSVASLRRELSAILGVVRDQDEVVVRLESGGGLVHSYGLASSQLQRVKSKGIKLTVCVDKVAASGGYLMACVADQILAAPFAIIGSIGVVAQIPNFHRLLKKHDVDFELVTAGDYKRTLTIFGENTEASRQKFRSEMEDTHNLFKEFVKEHRPQVNMEQVGTGEVWWGTRAAAVQLVDAITTSDEYLLTACKDADVLEVHFKERRRLQDRFFKAVEASLDRTLSKWWTKATSLYLS